ncbi:hypothetical protein [Saccharothrix xinjiangensis]|uniref:Uncharacterized protein n=1 Tax=Saccharothrix xinjiangensis TaxID=204798 RepID=A0ABV9XVD1_9PSEU
MTQVVFTASQPWALVPEAPKVDRRTARQERDLYAEHFRYRRVARLPVDCPPWVMGQELGWLVRSPITFSPGPVLDSELAVPDGEQAADVARKVGTAELWRRDGAVIAIRGAAWIREFDFRGRQGWEGMFLPNGAGTVEWRLGWEARIPERYLMLVLGAGHPGLDVPLGVLPAKVVNAMGERGGFSLAIHPTAPTTVQRGDPVARLVLLHPDSLQARSHTQAADDPSHDNGSDDNGSEDGDSQDAAIRTPAPTARESDTPTPPTPEGIAAPAS